MPPSLPVLSLLIHPLSGIRHALGSEPARWTVTLAVPCLRVLVSQPASLTVNLALPCLQTERTLL